MHVTDLFEPSRLPPAEQPKFANVLITRETADRALRSATWFRNIQPGRRNRYAADMTNDAWLDGTAECIKFDVKGKLIDGMHRLEAIKQSGVATEASIAYDLPEQAIAFVDQGMPRTAAQVLAFRGIPNAPTVVAILRWVLRHTANLESSNLKGDSGRSPSTPDIEVALESHSGVRQSAALVRRTDLVGIAPESVVGFVHYMGGKTSPSKADLFVESFASGEGLERGSPILLLRNRLIPRKPVEDMPGRTEVCALVTKAWTHFEAGTSPGKFLKWGKGERFPRFAYDDLDAKAKVA